MANNSYQIEIRHASKSGYDTPDEARRRYGRYSRDNYIVHWFGAPGKVGNHDQTVDYILRQASAGNMSVNYVLSNDKITMIVPPDDVSWGGQGGNPTGVNVEHSPDLNEEGYKKAGWLKQQLEERWGRHLNLQKHADFFATACPGTINTGRIQQECDRWKSGQYDVPVVQAPLYTVEAILPRQVQVKAGSRKWNLGHDNFADVSNNKITEADNNTIFTATAVLHHREIPQYNYYLEDGNTPHGYNVLDCTDYTAPPPPYVPPAPPVQVKQAETVNFMVAMMCYPSLTDARMKWNMHLEVNIEPNTTYYVHEKVEKFYKISDKNMTDRDWWVNLDDNKLPVIIPLPEPPVIEIITKPVEVLLEVPEVKWFWYNEDQQPTVFRYKGFKSAVISNLENHSETLNLPPNAQGPISRYAMINGNTYLIPDSEFKRGKLYGIYKELMEEVEDRPIRQALDTNDDGQVNVYDLAFIMTPAKDLYTKALPVIVKSQVFIKNNSKQVLDGFSARRKK